ncbi:HTH-type transcriptional activator IlvY [Alkalimonas amylolytica]|uniref:LysR family transcriptional regulator, positive regulator for ilvC n=1 Tax=Alkalimonas amylolytica TaxID=152573 RepID=A0A1H3YCJ2_ALKAM|nr:HTH-type transcriptional activator IlvY [Alkalimonas amylolytica]SEA08672.1 LysR family transcriptional regulator, positive regulator for ilvC [Alkalimonas amylolytica]
MDIKQAQLFMHLAASLNFARTSEQMFVSPSTLSRAIQRLEQELGVQLFLRDTRSVELTREGKTVLTFVRQYLDAWHQLQSDLSSGQAELQGSIRLFCTVTASYSHLPAILDKFRVLCPKADIQLTTGDAASALERLKQDEVDIALAARPEHLPASMLFHSIAKLPVSLAAPSIACKVNDLLGMNPIPWSEVPLIAPAHGPAAERFEKWLHSKGFRPNIVAMVDGHEAMASMVALGSGVAVLADVVVQHSPVVDRVRLLDSHYQFEPFDLGICYLAKRVSDPLLQAFCQLASPQPVR